MKPKAVLAYCREKGVKAVDIRFPDGMGRWKHFSIPASSLTESVFEAGLGLESCFSFQTSEELAPWILVPVADANYLDPSQSEPTLVLMASIQDAWTGEEAWFDPRALALRAMEAFRGTGLAEDLLISTTVPFHSSRSPHVGSLSQSIGESRTAESPVPSNIFAGGRYDPDAPLRWVIMHSAIESGLAVERHYRGSQSSSEFLLSAKPLVQACDDHLLLRSLIESTAMQQDLALEQSNLFSKSSWTLTKGNEPILGGSRGFGLSELGWYAAGGILKHAQTIDAIAWSSPYIAPPKGSSIQPILSDRVVNSRVCVEPMSNDPRYRTLAFRSTPATSCPYLTLSAIAMAMLDGVLQKIAPVSDPVPKTPHANSTEPSKALLADQLAQDSGFLLHADVFSERLIDSLCNQLLTKTP